MLKSRYWLTNCSMVRIHGQSSHLTCPSKCEIGVPLFPSHQCTCTFLSIGLLRGLNHMLSACWFERTFCVHMGVAFSSAPEFTNFLRKCWLHKLLLWYLYLKTSVPQASMSKIHVTDVSVFFILWAIHTGFCAITEPWFVFIWLLQDYMAILVLVSRQCRKWGCVGKGEKISLWAEPSCTVTYLCTAFRVTSV